ncbi:MAG TPA: ABC transporter permease [Gemmataceae bacterium]|jgi:ABC-type transport system involved in multi-copper enzyme maturation permease subunit|nr:ABC transporter permease [Gemmataceae bacterium]
MRYLAILKDSFREAIDAKVFYVMVGLSAVLIVLAGSISFRPLALEEELTSAAQSLTWIYSLQGPGNEVHFRVVEFKQLNDAPEPWRGDYRFVLGLRSADKDSGGAGRLSPGFVKALVQSQLPWLENLKVTKAASADPREKRLVFTTGGTSISSPRGWAHEPSLFFGTVPLSFLRSSLGYRIYWIEDWLVNGLGAWIAILVGIVITAFFIPNMLRKGTIDLLLAKPIRRPELLILKYIGGLSFIFLNAAVVVVGIWVVLGLRSGIWTPGFLLTVFVLTFFFAILYSVSTLFGVVTRSPIVAILMTCLVWFVLWIVGVGFEVIETLHNLPETAQGEGVDSAPTGENPGGPRINLPAWVYPTFRAIHYVLPRTKDLDLLTSRLLSRGVLSEAEIHARALDRTTSITWAESLTASGVFITLMLGIACWRFAGKDY